MPRILIVYEDENDFGNFKSELVSPASWNFNIANNMAYWVMQDYTQRAIRVENILRLDLVIGD